MCVCMREYARSFWAHLPISAPITDSTRGWPRLGLLTLPTAGRESKCGAHAKNVAMHLCVCLITLI